MNTGQRWSGKVSPRDLTATRQQQLLKEHAAREAAADIDVGAIRREAYAAAFEPAYVAGAQWAFNVLREAGIDVDAVLDLDGDEHQDDEPTGDE